MSAVLAASGVNLYDRDTLVHMLWLTSVPIPVACILRFTLNPNTVHPDCAQARNSYESNMPTKCQGSHFRLYAHHLTVKITAGRRAHTLSHPPKPKASKMPSTYIPS